MVNLEDKIGFPVILDDSNKLSFSSLVDVEKITERKFSDLAKVAKDQNLSLADDPAYTMYRNVKMISDADIISDANLRFDLTVIPATKLGEEYIKTSGHYHPLKPGTQLSYPELYFVISGEATYLLQKNDNGTITDVIVCEVTAPGAIIIPPGYGHVTINKSKETLVMANWISNAFLSNYEEFERLGGAAYFFIEKFGQPKEEKNKNYGDIPAIKNKIINSKMINQYLELPVYNLKDDLSRLDFLNNPEKHVNELAVDQLFG